MQSPCIEILSSICQQDSKSKQMIYLNMHSDDYGTLTRSVKLDNYNQNKQITLQIIAAIIALDMLAEPFLNDSDSPKEPVKATSEDIDQQPQTQKEETKVTNEPANPPSQVKEKAVFDIQIKGNTNTGTDSGQTRYKSKAYCMFVGIIISISGLNFGYALSACSVINLPQVMTIYGITLTQAVTHSLLIGLVPAGGILGAICNQIFVKYINRKYSIIIVASILWLGIALVLIHNPYTIFVGRFIQGFAVGIYLCLSPMQLKEVTPRELRARVMTFYGLGKSFGVVVAYSLQNIFIAAGYKSTSYIVLLSFNGYTAIIQVILMLIFVPHSPLQLVANNQIERARGQIAKIYKEQYVSEVLNEYIKDNSCQPKNKEKEVMQPEEKQQYKKKARRAYLIGAHVVLLRKLMGANCVTTFASQIIAVFAPSIAIYMGLMLNCILFAFNLIFMLFVADKFGRRPILTIGVGVMTVFSFGIAISLIEQSEVAILFCMSVYMALNGASVYTAGYSYPSEVLAPQQAYIPNIIGWIGVTIVTSLPPLVVGAMPGHNAYPCFLFFGTYGIFATIILILYMKESKGLTYKQIIQSF